MLGVVIVDSRQTTVDDSTATSDDGIYNTSRTVCFRLPARLLTSAGTDVNYFITFVDSIEFIFGNPILDMLWQNCRQNP